MIFGSSDVVLAIFSALAIAAILMVYFTSIIVIVIYKHRKDKAPFTSFMLHAEETKKEIDEFIYIGITILLTGVFTLTQKLLGPISLTNIPVLITYLLAYIFGILSALIMAYISYRWYKRFRRFLWISIYFTEFLHLFLT